MSIWILYLLRIALQDALLYIYSKRKINEQDAIHVVLKMFELDTRKLVGFGSDDCSTMMGPKSGVVMRLRCSGSPCMVGFHCPAHRLQLGILDVAGKVHSRNMNLILGCIYCID